MKMFVTQLGSLAVTSLIWSAYERAFLTLIESSKEHTFRLIFKLFIGSCDFQLYPVEFLTKSGNPEIYYESQDIHIKQKYTKWPQNQRNNFFWTVNRLTTFFNWIIIQKSIIQLKNWKLSTLFEVMFIFTSKYSD